MKGDLPASENEKSRIAREILAYLMDHPDARDTLEGIMQWWLLERKIKHQTSVVQEAICELVVKGLVSEHRRQDLQSCYSIIRKKSKEIKALLKQIHE